MSLRFDVAGFISLLNSLRRCPYITISKIQSLRVRELPSNLSSILDSLSSENDEVDFKESLDLGTPEGWCEILKDFVAMANSGGGIILIGVQDNGHASEFQVAPILELDPAKWTDKIASFTGEQFSDFVIVPQQRMGKPIAALIIEGASMPIVFTGDGTYPDPRDLKKPKFAFRRGTVYFRHNAKSEPGVKGDFQRFFDKLIELRREAWLGNIRQVMEAPADHRVVLVPKTIPAIGEEPSAIRLTNDPDATTFQKLNIDSAYPYRAKELITAVKAKTGKGITTHDISCLRKVHRIGDATPNFFHYSKYGAKQYSEEFLEWILAQYSNDPEFFAKTTAACKVNQKRPEASS